MTQPQPETLPTGDVGAGPAAYPDGSRGAHGAPLQVTSPIFVGMPSFQAAAREAGDAVDRRLLWRFGISGDRPIVLVSAGVMEGAALLRALAQALRSFTS